MIDTIYNEDEYVIKEELYKAQEDFTNVENDLIGTYLYIVRCLHNVFRDEDWHKYNIFYTYIIQNDKSYKVMINGENCVNIIFKSAV